jgi:predicted unusual protein kinase regulating ubiquinone biosynthesis (AarF/ABC1/UbiB family)
MEDILSQFLEEEARINNININEHVNRTTFDAADAATDAATATDNADAADATADDDSYEIKTREYYKKLGVFELITATYFTLSSCYICGIEYLKYKIGWKTQTAAVIDIAKRLATKNMLYVKIFQAYATNRTILNDELTHFFTQYTDNVAYTDDEYSLDDLQRFEKESVQCFPYKQLRIENDYKPIKSGLMSLIFKGTLVHHSNTDASCTPATPVVIKYLRKNIHDRFNESMTNLVLFAKLTKRLPYVRTLNIESVILQNIVCIRDQICFRKEVSNIQAYYKSWKDCDYIKIPVPFPEFTEKIDPNIIVMEYIDGFKLTEIEYCDNDKFAKLLASFNAKAAFCNYLYHGDLHPGNILFIKEPIVSVDTETETETETETVPQYKYKIGILDFGIIGRMSRSDQEVMFNLTKMVYQKKFKRIINYIITNISESLDTAASPTAENHATYDIYALLTKEQYLKLRDELYTVILCLATPEIKVIGVNELYSINFILNSYGLAFKRSLYKLLITLAIMDSIGTQLGTTMSYVQYMTDVVVDIFGIELGTPESDDDDDAYIV